MKFAIRQRIAAEGRIIREAKIDRPDQGDFLTAPQIPACHSVPPELQAMAVRPV
jgi:hypothetical protein